MGNISLFLICSPRRYSRAGDVSPQQHSLAKFSLELGLQEYQLLGVPASKQVGVLNLADPGEARGCFTNTVVIN